MLHRERELPVIGPHAPTANGCVVVARALNRTAEVLIVQRAALSVAERAGQVAFRMKFWFASVHERCAKFAVRADGAASAP